MTEYTLTVNNPNATDPSQIKMSVPVSDGSQTVKDACAGISQGLQGVTFTNKLGQDVANMKVQDIADPKDPKAPIVLTMGYTQP